MLKVTIIGATGSLGKVTTKILLNETDAELTLFSRTADTLPGNDRVNKISADISDASALEKAIIDADLVFVAISGDLPKLITKIVTAMEKVGTKRIVFISSYGIYGELPGQNGQVKEVLVPYRKAADILEASNLDYTILRPGWFDNDQSRDYKLIPKGEIIYENNISRVAIADFVKKATLNLSKYVKNNYGIVRD